MRKLWAAPVVLVAIVGAEGVGPHAVTAVRHYSVGDVTRIAVEVSADFDYRTDRLHNPERVYFDILNARPWIDSRRIYSQDFTNDRFVSRVRAAETAPGITRIVLELTMPVEVSVSKLPNPSRLIIELRAANVPDAAPGAPSVISSGRPPDTPPAVIKPAVSGTETAAVLPPKTAAKMASASAAQPSGGLMGADAVKTDSTRLDAPRMEPPRNESAKPDLAETVNMPRVPLPRLAKNDAGPPTNGDAGPATKTDAAGATPAAGIARGETGKAARRTSTGDNSLTRALGLKVARIVIDAGHGGHDQGTVGPHGLLEKDLVLDLALRVGKLVESQMGAEVIYTRTDDTFVPLEARTELANEKKADLFISIHVNSSSVPSTAGVETYFLNFSESKDALDVATRENASSQKTVFELRDIIQTITAHDKAAESQEFASRVQATLYAFSARSIPGSKNRGVKKAPFVVLIGANMPSVLAEVGFLSNPREEALLKKADYRQKLAEALFHGISRYADSLSHFQVAQN
jgi:N-acetylmuramoyl-L-alanine amidase